jgi:hypothetical protein
MDHEACEELRDCEFHGKQAIAAALLGEGVPILVEK